MAEWGPVVAEELRRDVRFALGWKVGKKPRPLTDTERDMVADAIVEHKANAIGESNAGRRGRDLRIWGDQSPRNLASTAMPTRGFGRAL